MKPSQLFYFESNAVKAVLFFRWRERYTALLEVGGGHAGHRSWSRSIAGSYQDLAHANLEVAAISVGCPIVTLLLRSIAR
jgi:hypothetical protein